MIFFISDFLNYVCVQHDNQQVTMQNKKTKAEFWYFI